MLVSPAQGHRADPGHRALVKAIANSQGPNDQPLPNREAKVGRIAAPQPSHAAKAGRIAAPLLNHAAKAGRTAAPLLNRAAKAGRTAAPQPSRAALNLLKLGRSRAAEAALQALPASQVVALTQAPVQGKVGGLENE